MRPRRLLSTRKHAVFVLDPGLLLVFKPRGHHEDVHAHPHRQRLRVLRGKLLVRVGGCAPAEARRAAPRSVAQARGKCDSLSGESTIMLTAQSRPLTVTAGRAHATRAVEDCWLLAEALPPVRRKA